MKPAHLLLLLLLLMVVPVGMLLAVWQRPQACVQWWRLPALQRS
jgi:hypothetical protein